MTNTMQNRSILRTFALIFALLLCLALLGLPTREAKAAVTGATISGEGSYTYTDTLGSYTVSADGIDATEEITAWSWSITAGDNVLAGTGNGATFTPVKGSGWQAGKTATISCEITVTKTDGANVTTATHTDTLDIHVTQATPTVTVSQVTAGEKLYPGGSLELKATVSPSGIAGTTSWIGTGATGLSVSPATGGLGLVEATSGTTTGSIQVTARFNPTDTVNYATSAPSAAFSVAANPLPRSISVSNPGPLVSGSGTTTLTATASPALETGEVVAWRYGTVTGSGVSFDANTGKITAADDAEGSVTNIYATLDPRGNYAAASSEPSKFTVQVAPATPVITGFPTQAGLAVGETVTLSTGVTSNNSVGTIRYELYDISPSGCVNMNNQTTGEIQANAVGTAKVRFTQAAGDNVAAVSAAKGNAPVCSITVSTPTFSFNTGSVTITADRGTTSVTAQVQYAGSAALAPVTLSGYNENIIQVNSTSTANGRNTFTIAARSQGDTTITATTTIGGVTQTATLPVKVDYANASYLSIDSWYHWLDYKNRYTEVTATLHNPGNGIDPGGRTNWYINNNVTHKEWSHEEMKYNEKTNTYYSIIRLKAMRNGTTIASVAASPTGSASYELHVTKMSYIPQSGQDSTAIYIVGALLAVSALTTLAVYGYRRKRQGA